jgi:hypothetical protein
LAANITKRAMMTIAPKPIDALEIADLVANPAWEFADGERSGDTIVHPMKRLPVRNLLGKVVGTQVRLANGSLVWGLIGNVDVNNPRLTEHFLTLSVAKDGQWFTLSRYHDFDYAQNGPDGFASFLGLPIDEVFPVAYDIAGCVQGDPEALSGVILKIPREKLTQAEIIAMAVP